MAGTINSGRRPKPTALHKLEGTRPQARATKTRPGREPQPQGDLREAPDWLTEDEREQWDYAIANAPPGLLKRLDRELLARWAQVASRLRTSEAAQHELNQRNGGTLPYLIKSKQGLQISPYIEIIDKATKQLIQLSDRLGFSPVARPRIQIEPSVPMAADADDGEDGWGVLKRFPVIDGGKKTS